MSALEEALLTSDAEVIHIQMNFGWFEFQRLAALLERQRPHRGVVMTLHRTVDYDDRGTLLTLREITPALRRVDQLIVHQESDVRHLESMGISENVHLVPLGASPAPDVAPDTVRAALGFGDRPVVGTFGFLLPHKGTRDLVVAVDELRSGHPDILLVAACAAYPGGGLPGLRARGPPGDPGPGPRRTTSCSSPTTWPTRRPGRCCGRRTSSCCPTGRRGSRRVPLCGSSCPSAGP